MERIILVGFSGAGKSTVGRRLAARLGWVFFDTDSFFEEKYHISVSNFFSKYGEEAFRVCEEEVLRELLCSSKAVIATGGGTPCFFHNMDLILESGYVVYLKLSSQSLFLRLRQSHKERPLVVGKSDEQLLEFVENSLLSREKFYKRAHLTFKGENVQLDELLRCVFEAEKEDGGGKK